VISGSLRESRNLDLALSEVEPKMRRNVLRTALRAGGNVVRDEARRTAPKKSGILRRAIKTVLRRERGTEVRASVGVFGGKGKNDAFYASFVEAGHRIVARRGKGIAARRRQARQEGGRVKPYPFLLPALIRKQNEVQETVMNHIADRLSDLV
jgi:HK97 gp10 family phage protein